MGLSATTDPTWPFLGDVTALCSRPGVPALCRDGQISGGGSQKGNRAGNANIATCIASIQDEPLKQDLPGKTLSVLFVRLSFFLTRIYSTA